MKIKKILSQNRRDFTAIYVCEHGQHEKEGSGYDDSYFHKEVIPGMVCESCQEKSGKDYVPKETKYPDSKQV